MQTPLRNEPTVQDLTTALLLVKHWRQLQLQWKGPVSKAASSRSSMGQGFEEMEWGRDLEVPLRRLDCQLGATQAQSTRQRQCRTAVSDVLRRTAFESVGSQALASNPVNTAKQM